MKIWWPVRVYRGFGFGPNNEFWRRYGETRNREIKEFNHWNRFEGNKRMQYSFCQVNLIQEQSEWERERVCERYWIVLDEIIWEKSKGIFLNGYCWWLLQCMQRSFLEKISPRLCAPSEIQKRNQMYRCCSTWLQKFIREQNLEISGVSELSWRTSTLGEAGPDGRRGGDQAHEGESLRILRFRTVRWKNTRIPRIQCRMGTSNFVV